MKRVPTQLTCDSVFCESKVSSVSQSTPSLVGATWNTLYFHTVQFLSDVCHSSYMTFLFGTKVGGRRVGCACVVLMLLHFLVMNSQHSVLNVQQDVVT